MSDEQTAPPEVEESELIRVRREKLARITALGYDAFPTKADMDTTNKYTGMLYEEKGRGILCKPGQKVTISAAEKDAADPKSKDFKIEDTGTSGTGATSISKLNSPRAVWWFGSTRTSSSPASRGNNCWNVVFGSQRASPCSLALTVLARGKTRKCKQRFSWP